MASFRDRLRSVRRRSAPGAEPVAGLDDLGEVIDVPVIVVEEGDADATVPVMAPPPVESLRELRRERAALVRRHEELRGDLGGLIVEMARRGRYNHALVERRAAEVIAIESGIAAVDGRMLAASEPRSTPAAATPEPLTVEEPAAAPAPPGPCRRCGAVLVFDANFCAYCGAPR